MKDRVRDIDGVIARALASEAETFAPKDLAAAEKRFLRGRRKRRFTWFGGATLATAAAIVAVAVFPRPELVKEDRVRVAGALTTISVGEAPTSVAATSTGVWVANSGDGTVSRIDPSTNEVVATIEVGGVPEELATDELAERPQVWVIDSEGRRMVEVQPETDTRGFEYEGEWAEGTHLDMAVKDETVWMGDPATETVYVDSRGQPPPGQPANFGPEVLFKEGRLPEGGGDVAVEDGAGEAWAYNGATGTLTFLQAADGTLQRGMERPQITDVLTSESGDLAVGGDALWVSDDFGVIMRIDRKTYEKEYLDLGGRHSDLSYGGGFLWALTASEAADGTATLRRIDPVTARVVGQEFALEGGPVDVSAHDDAVWVAHQDADTVTRIEVSASDVSPEPVP